MRKKRVLIATVCLVLFFSVGLTATASTLLENIRAILNKEVSITIDGAPWQAKSGDTVLYPITYKGSTYLPVRSVAEALDVPIQYDGETKTINIGSTSELVPVLSKTYLSGSATITEDENDRKIQGVDYGKVIWFEKILNSTSRFTLEPAGQYTKLVLNVGIEGDDTTIHIVNVNESSTIKTVPLTEADGVVEIEAGITGVARIEVQVIADEPNTSSTVRIVANDSYYLTE